MQENQHTRKLREAIEGYWNYHFEIKKNNSESAEKVMPESMCDAAKSEIKRNEYEKYLKLRIRPLMEFLIEEEDIEKMEDVAAKGWFSDVQLDGFLKMAGEKHCLSSFAWLLQWKKKHYGFKDKDFSL